MYYLLFYASTYIRTIFTHTVDFEASQDATPAAAIGGGVGGAVFLILLIIALYIVLRLVINSRKKRKVKYLNPAVLFMTSRNDSVTSNPRYVSEPPTIEITEKDTEIEERTGKLLSYT